MTSGATINPVLRVLAIDAVRIMPVPKSVAGLYPRIHATAYAIDWPNKAEALGAVFRVICEAVGVQYQSQYMDRALVACLEDGRLVQSLRKL